MLRFLAALFACVAIVALVAAAGTFYVFDHFGRDLPDHTQLARYEPPVTSRVYGGNGRLLAEYATEKRVFVPIDAIPKPVIDAFLAAEDKNFYIHPGVDIIGIVRAILTNISHYGSDRRPVGASTITQQVAKNFLLSNEVSITRKIKEAILAFRIDRAFSKDRILELYLNEIYLGYGSYGVAAAALNYFNKALDELSIEEIAFLAALPKAPNNYDPARYPAAAKARRNWVLGRMQEEGFPEPGRNGAGAARRRWRCDRATRPNGSPPITSPRRCAGRSLGSTANRLSIRAASPSAPPSIPTCRRWPRRRSPPGWRIMIAATAGAAPSPASRQAPTAGFRAIGASVWRRFRRRPVLARGVSRWSAALAVAAPRSPLSMTPPVSFPCRSFPGRGPGEKARRSAKNRKKPADVLGRRRRRRRRPGRRFSRRAMPVAEPAFALKQLPAVDGALVAMDPHTGRVLAMAGGYSYARSQFNRATQANRQTGSAFKPVVYLCAMENGLTPASIILDAPFIIDQGPGLPPWSPSNYSDRYYGPTTLRTGLEQSRNVMTVRLAETVGMDKIAGCARRLQLFDNLPPYLSYALGAGETTLIHLTTAYAMLVNGGKALTATLIDRIQDRYGKTIYRHDDRDCPGCNAAAWTGQAVPALPDTSAEVTDPASAYQIVSMLEGVVQRGTARTVSAVGKPLAGKTGTTNDARDAWFVGFSPDLAVGVFVGFDEPTPLGHKEAGGSVAAPIFRDFMKEALADKPATPFRIPPGIRLVRINAETGQLARAGDRRVILEAFKPGTEPRPAPEEAPTAAGAGRLLTGTGGLY